MGALKLAKYIANLGYGSRREVERMIAEDRVLRRDGSPLREGDAFTHDDVLVDGVPLDPPPGSLILLHKPVGYVCSSSASETNPLVYDLLPRRFLHRSPVIAPIGRLDRDTSGLLLLTDDGQLNHRLTSPRRHVAKTYLAELASDLRGDEVEIFASGSLLLAGEERPLLPAVLEVVAPRTAKVTITEGRYHQVRRMFAAVGNHVTALHRIAVGQWRLDGLEEGEWTLTDHPSEYRNGPE